MKALTEPTLLRIAVPSMRRAVGIIAATMARFLTLLVILVLIVPLALLLVNTLVPAPVILLLVLVDAAIVLALSRSGWGTRATLSAIAGVLAVAVLAVYASQVFAATPPILGSDGMPLPGSVASQERVKLGGVDQWLVIRGKSVNNPVLLFLSGGPGGSELGRVRRFNEPLEDYFTLVVWEQRGCGKSYDAINATSALTVQQYTSDVIELSEMLRTRFHQDKIYLLGHSWGTIIGVRAAQQRPDLYYAYIGTGQMVNVRETDQTIYRMLLENAKETGNAEFAARLKAIGEPPYFGASPINQYKQVLGSEYGIFEEPNIKSERYKREGSDLVGQAFIPEYGWIDRINFGRGAMDTFNVVFPQLQDFDFRKDALQFQVPVYFFLGRHDVNATYWLAEEYLEKLQAPIKHLEFFEDSGHGNLWQEPDKFHALMRQVVAETYPSVPATIVFTTAQ